MTTLAATDLPAAAQAGLPDTAQAACISLCGDTGGLFVLSSLSSLLVTDYILLLFLTAARSRPARTA